MCKLYTKMCNCLGRLSSEMENSFASVKSEFDVNLKEVCWAVIGIMNLC